MKVFAILPVFMILAVMSKSQTSENAESFVNFSLSNLGLFTVQGTVKGMKGTVIFRSDAHSNARFDVCVDAATINTGNRKRDEHLRSSDWFNVARHPEICFQSSSVKQTAIGYLAKGELTMRGVTKSVELPFTHSEGKLIGTLTLSRLTYGVGVNTGTFTVGDDVTVTITCNME